MQLPYGVLNFNKFYKEHDINQTRTQYDTTQLPALNKTLTSKHPTCVSVNRDLWFGSTSKTPPNKKKKSKPLNRVPFSLSFPQTLQFHISIPSPSTLFHASSKNPALLPHSCKSPFLSLCKTLSIFHVVVAAIAFNSSSLLYSCFSTFQAFLSPLRQWLTPPPPPPQLQQMLPPPPSL